MNTAESLQVVVDGGGPATMKIFFIMTPQLPPNPVLIGLSLFLTLFVMGPTADRLHQEAVSPYLDDKVEAAVAAAAAEAAILDFIVPQTRSEDLALFYDLAHLPAPAAEDDIPLRIAVPAFLVSELTTAFKMGLYIFIPLVIIDLLVASVLMSLGMMMVPPAMVALPLKLAVFLLADGWRLIVAALARSFHGA
jgi:flagellar biosynthetic protein FliP